MQTVEKHTTTHTEATAHKLERTHATVKNIFGYTEEDIFWLRMDVGRRFAREFTNTLISGREEVYTNLTQNPDWNFWNWWNMQWLFDDDLLLRANCLNENTPYPQLKEALIGAEILIKDLYWMIKQYTDLC